MHIDPLEMEALARAAWGEPNARLSSKKELRYGTNGSKSVKPSEGVWYDNEAAKGGGYRDLYRLVHGHYPTNGHAREDDIPGFYVPPRMQADLGKPVGMWDYHDAAGAIICRVVRFHPPGLPPDENGKPAKTFRQCRPDGNRWKWSVTGIEVPLYRLPELRAAPADAVVFVTEGEKKADALAAWGLLATTNAMGAGKFREHHARLLAGRVVVVLPDNDLPGQGHAADVAAMLRGIAASVVVVSLPDLPVKGDIIDWIAAGGTVEALTELVAKARQPADEPDDADPADEAERPEAEPVDSPADILSAVAWTTLDIPPDVRLLGDVITSSTSAFLVGTTGLGKTLLAYAWAAGMATGKGFLNWTCDRPSKWLIIDGEMPSILVKARAIDMIRRAGGIDAFPVHGVTIYSRARAAQFAAKFPGLGELQPLNTEAGHTFVRALIAALGGVDGVIFDNLMSLAPGDQKDEQTWAGCIPLFESLSRDGIAQIYCDHTGINSARQYGSSTKAWRVETVGIITPLSETERPSDHTAFHLGFDPPGGKARNRRPDNWQDFAPQIVRLINDTWVSELIGGAKPASEARLGSKPADLLHILRNMDPALFQTVKPEREMFQVSAVRREHLRAALIAKGWFPEDAVCTGLDGLKLVKPGFAIENNHLTVLRTKKLINFDRYWIWLIS